MIILKTAAFMAMVLTGCAFLVLVDAFTKHMKKCDEEEWS